MVAEALITIYICWQPLLGKPSWSWAAPKPYPALCPGALISATLRSLPACSPLCSSPYFKISLTFCARICNINTMKAVGEHLSSVLRVTHSYITAHSRTFFNCLLQRQQKENTSAISVVLPEGFHIKPLRPSFSNLWEKWGVFLFPIACEKKHSNKNEINEKANASLMNTFRDKTMYQYSKAHFHAYAYLLKEPERQKSGSQLHHWAVKPGNTVLRKGWLSYPSVSLKGNQLCSTAGAQHVHTTELLCITQGLATDKTGNKLYHWNTDWWALKMYFLTDTGLHCTLASHTTLSGALKTSRVILLREKHPPAQEFKTLQYEK